MRRVLSVSYKPFTDNLSLGPQFIPPFVLDKWINGTSWGAGRRGSITGMSGPLSVPVRLFAARLRSPGRRPKRGRRDRPAADRRGRFHKGNGSAAAPESNGAGIRVIPAKDGTGLRGQTAMSAASLRGSVQGRGFPYRVSLSRLELFLLTPTSWAGPGQSLSGFSVIDPFSDIFWEAA